MNYRTIQPSIELRDYVRFYWFLESDEPYVHYAMADVCPELVFHVRGQFDEISEEGSREPSFVSGLSAPTDHTRTFCTGTGFGIFGVYLFPHTIPALFDVPASELKNQMIDLESLLKFAGADLEAEVMTAHTDRERIGIVESFIRKRLANIRSHDLPVFRALKDIIGTTTTLSVRQLSDDYRVSERQLERQFLKYTGFSPKQFTRITRFHRAMQFYQNCDVTLAEIAIDCGYYDQAHFSYDFKRFSGVTPKTFFSGRSPATAWRD